MNNNQFPPLEPENSLPEVLPEIPERMEPLDEFPVIQELSFTQEPEAEQTSRPEAPGEEPEQAPEIQEIPMVEEIIPEPETPAEEPDAPQEPCIPEVFTESIPSTDTETNRSEQPSEAIFPPEPPVVMWQEPEEEPIDLDVSDESSAMPVMEEIQDQEYRGDDPDFDLLMNQKSLPREEKPFTMSGGNYKGRPQRKKGEGLLGIPSILVTFVWLALIVIIGVTAGRMLWICAADVLAFGREDKVVTVTVYESDSMDDIIDKLHAGGLIRYKSLFSLYADISDAQEDIKPGIYDLNTRYDYHALVNFMSPRSSREVIKLTIPEGYTCRQIFALLEENRICTAKDAAAYAANGELDEYWFLEGLERGAENCLEGYLFPDTYEFYKNSTPREAIERMLDNFEYRFDGDMLTKLDDLNKKVTDGSYGIREIVIIASLIEKESAAPGESPMVSGVIYNRLFRWGNNRPLLNIDASIVYAQDGQNERIDTKLDHPYNTYLYEGLTPGPIANPGLASLKAALNPESHNYYYYVLNPETGMHQFSTTYEEHQSYVRQFNAAPEVEIE